MSKGHFIVFEGIDGSGTTTQCRILSSYLEEAGARVTLTREPGGTPAAEQIRRLVLDPQLGDLSYMAELFLIAASRSQHVEELIQPSLDRGEVVICDRYIASSLAYQGYGRGLDLEIIKRVNLLAVGNCVPDVTIYLDLPLEVARARRDQRGDTADRLEQAGEDLQERVARGYRDIAGSEQTARVFDARLDQDQLASCIRDALREQWLWFPIEENKA
ncbi:MAG: dTMP kinase [Candidatus Latescibacterota bacterium]|nr:dTMP kinase [Candidatus Latescibacterota bacterium]